MRGIAQWRLGALLVLLAGQRAQAHTLDVGTARITLRDQHLEVDAEIDLLALSSTDPTALATGSEALLEAERDRVRRRLMDESRLGVDGSPRRIEVTALPPPPELRALAATLSAAGATHGALARVRLESPVPVDGAGAVSLSLPEALGSVLITFVQPAVRLTPPGEAARFDVLVRPSPSAKRRGERLAMAALALLALGALAGVALAQRWRAS